MNPLFEATVQHPQNHQLFCEVVKQVESQLIVRLDSFLLAWLRSKMLQKNSDSLPPSLKHEILNFTWERDLLYEMTKTSFRSCKDSWRKQTDQAVGQRDHVNQRVNRRRERRVTVYVVLNALRDAILI
jgi:hypothetical protein